VLVVIVFVFIVTNHVCKIQKEQSDRRTYIQQDGDGNDKAQHVSYTTAVPTVWPFL